MEMKIEAADMKRGMDVDEVMAGIVRARGAGCTRLKATRVGFRNQIQSMTFVPDEPTVTDGPTVLAMAH